jgi:hypothetical protein
MKVARLLPFLILVLAMAWLTLNCGSGNGRQLQSITLTQTTINNGQDVQFVATGTFSAPPTTVTPLLVDWTNGLMAPPPQIYNYTLSTQPYVVNCTVLGPAVPQVVAFAPPDPNAPTSGTSKTVVTAAAMAGCLAVGQSGQ